MLNLKVLLFSRAENIKYYSVMSLFDLNKVCIRLLVIRY